MFNSADINMDALEVAQRLYSDNTDDEHNKQGTDAQNCCFTLNNIII